MERKQDLDRYFNFRFSYFFGCGLIIMHSRNRWKSKIKQERRSKLLKIYPLSLDPIFSWLGRNQLRLNLLSSGISGLIILHHTVYISICNSLFLNSNKYGNTNQKTNNVCPENLIIGVSAFWLNLFWSNLF